VPALPQVQANEAVGAKRRVDAFFIYYFSAVKGVDKDSSFE